MGPGRSKTRGGSKEYGACVNGSHCPLRFHQPQLYKNVLKPRNYSTVNMGRISTTKFTSDHGIAMSYQFYLGGKRFKSTCRKKRFGYCHSVITTAANVLVIMLEKTQNVSS